VKPSTCRTCGGGRYGCDMGVWARPVGGQSLEARNLPRPSQVRGWCCPRLLLRQAPVSGAGRWGRERVTGTRRGSAFGEHSSSSRALFSHPPCSCLSLFLTPATLCLGLGLLHLFFLPGKALLIYKTVQ
jgi:hypothetical protein